MTSAIALRQQLLKIPKPPLTEEQVAAWEMPDEQRAAVLGLIRFAQTSHDQWLDVAANWETKMADAESRAYSAQLKVDDLADERKQVNAAQTLINNFVTGLGAVLGVRVGSSLEATLDAVLVTVTDLRGEVTRLRADTSPRCGNCGMPHFTEDCDHP